MIIKEAVTADIKQIQAVRNSVTENTLSDPNLVTDADCADFITNRGKGWVCEIDNQIVGFAIADLVDENIWALFLDPRFENRGIGRKLHDVMIDWYFSTGKDFVWLGTSPKTRAETFYRKSGWTENGMHGKNEIKFEMTRQNWENYKRNKKLNDTP